MAVFHSDTCLYASVLVCDIMDWPVMLTQQPVTTFDAVLWNHQSGRWGGIGSMTWQKVDTIVIMDSNFAMIEFTSYIEHIFKVYYTTFISNF